MSTFNHSFLALVLGSLALFAGAANAGRPLTVDDASTNAAGEGHVEAWYARLPGKANSWNISPAYAPIEGLEFSGLLSRDTTAKATITAVQFKWLLTPASESGCNAGVVGGLAHERVSGEGSVNAPYWTGLATCRQGSWAGHLNLGRQHPRHQTAVTMWGLALEKTLGPVTAHVEVFGERHGRPTRQVGLRTELRPGLQIDGTVGRGESSTVFSIGLKQAF